MAGDVKFGGTAQVSDKDPNVARAIASSVTIQSHPFWSSNPNYILRESGNLVTLSAAERQALGLAANDSVVLTDAHGVEDANGAYTVTDSKGQKHAATLVKLDDVRDLAYLKITDLKPGTLPSVTIADNDDTQPGDLVYSVGHVGFDAAVTVNGGTYTGMTSKQDEMKKLDKIFSQGGKTFDYAGNYLKIVNQLGTGDKANALVDYNRPLMATTLHDKEGMSGGGLFNSKGQIIGVLEATEEDPSLGDKARDVHVPLRQISAFRSEPPMFKFTYGTTVNDKGETVPALMGITRVNGDSRRPFSANDLIGNKLQP